MVSQPFSDALPKDGLIAEKGAFYFLKVAIKRNGLLLPADASTWVLTTVAVIKDPAGATVTSSFVTNELDPNGVYDANGNLLGADTYNASHATYKGALAAPANVGLFSDDGGHIALKILVPTSATENYLTSDSWYTVYWTVKVSDGAGGLVTITANERFKVAPAGTFIFEDASVTAADVTKGLSTSMEPEQVADIIDEAVEWFKGEVIGRSAGTLTDVTTLGYNGKRAIILKARSIVFTFDVTAGLLPNFVREGPDQVRYGNRDALAQKWDDEAEKALKLFLRDQLGLGKPFVSRVDRALQADSPPFDGLVLVV